MRGTTEAPDTVASYKLHLRSSGSQPLDPNSSRAPKAKLPNAELEFGEIIEWVPFWDFFSSRWWVVAVTLVKSVLISGPGSRAQPSN